MALSSVGKKKLALYALLILLDIVVLALAARVNIFQEFFFMADLFPFVLSIVSLVILLAIVSSELASKKAFLAMPISEIGLLCTMSIFWLGFNAFSTMRWRFIPLDCNSIPDEYVDERVWCRDVQALKSLVWIFFVALLCAASFVLRFAYQQHRKGNRHIWTTPLSRFKSHLRPNLVGASAMDRATITDYFGTTANDGPWQQPRTQQPWEKF